MLHQIKAQQFYTDLGLYLLHAFLLAADLFQNQIFEKLFQEHHQSVKQLDPDTTRRFFEPDLGPSHLQRLLSLRPY